MAYIEKTAKGYRAHVAVKGHRESMMHRTKREAEAWAASLETELRQQAKASPAERYTLADLLTRYRDEVSVKKRGARWEAIRINRFIATSALAAKKVSELTADDFGRWRDKRAKEISAGSLIREMGQLSTALETARREWKWLDTNPLSDVRRPSAPEHRDRVITRREIRAMLAELGYSPAGQVTQVRHVVAILFLVALRTGMRAGELCGLTWDRVYADHIVLRQTKTKPRNVPLSSKARRLFDRMRGWDAQSVFGLKVETLDAMFRKYRNRAGLSGFTFHDSRHTAATWMARKVDVLTLCKIFGWARTTQALTYFNPSASDIAKQLG